jgi:hypothetical protein
MTHRHPNLRTIVAIAIIAIGLAGTIIDPDGVVGVILFGAAAAALLHLVARPVARLIRTVQPPSGGFAPRRVAPLLRWRTITAIALGSGALLGATNLFDSNSNEEISRILNDATFLGGFALIAAIALVALGTAARWARSACHA